MIPFFVSLCSPVTRLTHLLTCTHAQTYVHTYGRKHTYRCVNIHTCNAHIFAFHGEVAANEPKAGVLTMASKAKCSAMATTLEGQEMCLSNKGPGRVNSEIIPPRASLWRTNAGWSQVWWCMPAVSCIPAVSVLKKLRQI